MGLVDNLYKNLPIPAQNLSISLYGWYWQKRRFGGLFKQELENFRSRNSWTEVQWKEYQEQKLKDLLIHAFTHVPFYKEKYSQAGFQLSDFQNFKLENLSSLPFLEKQELREFGETKLLAENREKGTFYSSSGSTGTPTKIYYSPRFHQTWSAAFEVRIREWAGVDRFSSRGMIGGRVVVPSRQQKPPYFRINTFEKQYYFSINHLSANTASSYLNVLRQKNIEYLTGYANSVWLLAKYGLEQNLPKVKLKAVITSSEKLTSQMRLDLGVFFQCNVYDSYSGVEACGLISQCANGNLHWSQDLGILETVNIGTSDTDIKELVCTGLLNFDQPLIRYKIGDLISISKEDKCKCGVGFPIIDELVGRIDDIVTLKDGRKLGSFNRFFADLSGIAKVQVIQLEYSKFKLKIVRTPEVNFNLETEICQVFNKRIGEVELFFEYVEDILPEKNGKVKAVISNL